MPQSKDAFDPLIGQADWESSEREREMEKKEKLFKHHYSFLLIALA